MGKKLENWEYTCDSDSPDMQKLFQALHATAITRQVGASAEVCSFPSMPGNNAKKLTISGK